MTGTVIAIPVYNGFDATARCLRALAAARPSAPHRVLIINDASPDARVAPLLDDWVLAQANAQVRHNAINRGFTWNVNQAFVAARDDEHVCLLNSDTEVSIGWLDTMLATAGEDARIGTVTPFSNNATICSFPDFTRAWPLPSRDERERIARALQVEPAPAIDLPTGVGFCMLITAACRAAVGRFDVDNFPRGYGEENDFCMRAAAAGFRNVLCPNAYVAHEGGVSFSEATQALMKEGAARLLGKHPSYDTEVTTWIARDPVKARREAVVRALAAPQRAAGVNSV